MSITAFEVMMRQKAYEQKIQAYIREYNSRITSIFMSTRAFRKLTRLPGEPWGSPITDDAVQMVEDLRRNGYMK